MMANPREDSIFRDQELTDTDIPAPRSSHCNAVSGSGSGLAWSARANRTVVVVVVVVADQKRAALAGRRRQVRTLYCWIAGLLDSAGRSIGTRKVHSVGASFKWVDRSAKGPAGPASRQQRGASFKFQFSRSEVRGSRVSCVRQHSITIDKYIPRNLFRSATAWICVARRAER